jgi:acetylornithine/N-succinyldiaminopimelate aminotransferase
VIASVLPSYARAPLTFERGEGPHLFSADGRKYLDFTSGVAVVSLGHANPRLVKALTDQAQRLWHCSNLFEVEGQKRVAAKLIANSFADTVFFCNSGAEAVEAAIKIGRKYQAASGHPEKFRIIACTGSFHGRTLATLAAAGNEKYLAGFGPPLEGFDHVAFGNLNEMRAAVTVETAAVLVEPVQGEGGLSTPPPGYLKGLRQLCDEYGLMLVYDEVQSGMGRAGKLFAHQWDAEGAPDILATAKGLGGGFPVGACLATEKAAIGMVPGTHGSTFGGNPLAMAVAEEVLNIMLEPGFFEHVNEMGKALRSRLDRLVAAYPNLFAETRGA